MENVLKIFYILITRIIILLFRNKYLYSFENKLEYVTFIIV
jgi:hypothetical protein